MGGGVYSLIVLAVVVRPWILYPLKATTECAGGLLDQPSNATTTKHREVFESGRGEQYAIWTRGRRREDTSSFGGRGRGGAVRNWNLAHCPE